MRRRVHAGWLFLGLGTALSTLMTGCASEAPSTVKVTITPDESTVLTCSVSSFSATVSSTASNDVTWSLTPSEGYGSIDDTGTYTAPARSPTPATVTISATSVDEPGAHASVQATLATAVPSVAQPLSGAPGIAALGGAGTYVHVVAARGARIYAAWPDDSDASTALLKVARSDDGGATWNHPVTAMSAALLEGSLGSAGGLECPAIAIDAGNPDVIYAVGHVVAENEYSKPLDDSTSGAQTELLAVSTDAGAQWTTYVLHVGAAGDVCADVASPVPDNVVVVSPGWSCSRGDEDLRDLFVWSDPDRGAGFADGAYTDSPVEYFANGYVASLGNLTGDDCGAAHIIPLSDGGTDDSGDAAESPRLFTNGAGELCVTYVGDVIPKDGATVTNVYVQCSTDAGQSFSDVQKLDNPTLLGFTSATGALGADGVAAIAYGTAGSPDHRLYVSFSNDGQTFGTPATVSTYFESNNVPSHALNPALAFDSNGVLWLGYRTADSGSVIVDKSCDGGQTFSGPVAVTKGNKGPRLKWPTFATTDAAAPPLFAWGDASIASYTLTPPLPMTP
jgi:hypothetical protein